MEYRSLGRTGMKVSSLCLGCMMFGWKADEAQTAQMIHHAMDQGINFLDTANVYARGVSEEYTGKALQNGRRNKVVLATKAHGKMDDHDPNAWGNHRRNLLMECEASLRRLSTDWIDLYQIHRPQSEIPIDETLRALDDLIRSGKVRYIGTSTYAAWQLMEAMWVAKELGLNRFVCEQPPYHLLDRRVERELIPMAQTYGVGIIPWSPLAGGYLSGKYRRNQEPPKDARIQGGNDWAGRNKHFFSEPAYRVVDVLEEMAKGKGCSVSQLALAWVMNQPGVTSPIIGPRNMEQLIDNLGTITVTVTDDDRKKLDEVATPRRAIVPYYEADFGGAKVR